jgi:hypothetical protein
MTASQKGGGPAPPWGGAEYGAILQLEVDYLDGNIYKGLYLFVPDPLLRVDIQPSKRRLCLSPRQESARVLRSFGQ